jgi:hypothetical protein
VAGLAGVAVMTVGEKLEQQVTGRPNSYVPARTLIALTTGKRLPESARPLLSNHVMHYGTGALLGALRGVWSAAGLRGVRASAWHTTIRLAVDQTLENVTGVGSPPWTWSRRDQLIDVGHKAVYSLATGAFADRLVAPARGSSGTRGLWD